MAELIGVSVANTTKNLSVTTGVSVANTTQNLSVTLGDSSGSGTSNYNLLSNKPQINAVTLQGNKGGHDLSLANLSDISVDEALTTNEIMAICN